MSLAKAIYRTSLNEKDQTETHTLDDKNYKRYCKLKEKLMKHGEQLMI